MMVPGSVILFKSSGKWYERAIEIATGGPWVHAEIAYVGGLTIGAHPHGITTSPAPINPNTYTTIDITPYTSQDKIDAALAWAEQQIGDEYGWSDILFQAIKFLWPNNKLRFGVEGRWDCADFAVRYLQQAGVILPDQWNDPYSMTPNDIDRVFKLPSMQKAVQ